MRETVIGLKAGYPAFRILWCSSWIVQELSSILEFVPQSKKNPKERIAEVSGSEEEEDEDQPAPKKKRRLQTFVFSATLTLPEGLRRRLKRGESAQIDFWPQIISVCVDDKQILQGITMEAIS